MAVILNSSDTIHIPDVTLHDMLLQRIAQHGMKLAFIKGETKESCTYADVFDQVKKVASGLAKAGLKKGDVVLISAPNCPEFSIALLGILATGGIMTGCNPLSTERELLQQMVDSESKYIITIPAIISKVKNAALKQGNVKKIYLFGNVPVAGVALFSELQKDAGDAYKSDVGINPREDVAVILYSSGTTGKPKGVMKTHRNLIFELINKYDSEHGHRILPFPPYHLAGLFSSMVYIDNGSTIITMESFRFETYLSHIQEYKVEFLTMPPPILVLLTKHPVVDKYDISSVKSIVVGSAPVGKDIEIMLQQRLGRIQLRQIYGMTETGNATIVPAISALPNKSGSAGVLIKNISAKVIDINNGECLGPHKPGEILIQSPGTLKGYLKNPEATCNIIDRDNWVHTGDIGYYDEDGYFYVVDRLKQLIKYMAFQVSPAELEALLLGHPGIADAAVIGLPDDFAGELPKAFVVKKPKINLTEKDVTTFINERVVYYKKLRGGVEFISKIPKSPSGKILHRMLKEKELHKIESKI